MVLCPSNIKQSSRKNLLSSTLSSVNVFHLAERKNSSILSTKNWKLANAAGQGKQKLGSISGTAHPGVTGSTSHFLLHQPFDYHLRTQPCDHSLSQRLALLVEGPAPCPVFWLHAILQLTTRQCWVSSSHHGDFLKKAAKSKENILHFTLERIRCKTPSWSPCAML